MPYLYSIRVSSGIKIGYASNVDRRLSQHKTLGEPVVLIKVIKIEDRSIDGTFKKILKKLDLVVSVSNNDQATEVYNLTEDQCIAILEYIDCHQSITEQAVKNIIDGKTEVYHTDITYGEICDSYGSKYKKPRFQREVSDIRVDNLKTFILENYQTKSFYLPPVILARLPEDNERYSIIDGQHRCAAISLIDRAHPCMANKLLVVIFPTLTLADQLRLFRNINKSAPVPHLCLDKVYITDIMETLCTKITKEYGNVIKEGAKTTKFSSTLHTKTLDEFVTEENINKLWNQEILEAVNVDDIFEFLKDLNDNIRVKMIHIAGDPLILQSDSKYTNMKALLPFFKMINGNLKESTEKDLLKAITEIRKQKKKFVLGLIRVPILDAYRNLTESIAD